MVQVLRPTTAQELATALRDAASHGEPFTLEGAGSKRRMGGRPTAGRVSIEMSAMGRLLQYDPRDLTISVEAGMPWARFVEITAEQGQMAPLDPPLAGQATVGGVVAANCTGARRRLYGAVRDQVIGMQCATLEGEVVDSGGMVVKNVAGYDLQKLMIGSFGTLAAIASVNFKLAPKPEGSSSFALAYDSLEDALGARNEILSGALQPAAVDFLNPAAAAGMGLVEAHVLLVRAGGSARVLERYARDLPGASRLEGAAEEDLWTKVADFAPAMVKAWPQAVVVKASFPLQALGRVMQAADGPAVARAANGVAWLGFEDAERAAGAFGALRGAGAAVVVEWAGDEAPEGMQRWPEPGAALEVMRDLKRLFDPDGLMNRGRLHGRI